MTQFLLPKSYILQKSFPIGHETTNFIRENRKKEELERNKQRTVQFPEKMELISSKEGKIKQLKLMASSQNRGKKNFWRTIKALCGDSKKSNKTEQCVGVSYKQLRA